MGFRQRSWIVAVALFSVLLNAVAGQPPPSVLMVGSSTLTPLVEATAAPFFAKTHVRVLARPIGSARGVAAAAQGDCALGLASRDLTDPERSQWPALEQITVARDVIGIYVNSSNPLEDLSLVQLQDIYTGRITDWDSIWPSGIGGAGRDTHIEAVTKNVGHGTLDSFISLLGLDENVKLLAGRLLFKRKGETAFADWAGAHAVDRFNESAGEVTHRRNAIAYDSLGAMQSLGSLTAQIKLLKIDGVSPGLDTAQRGQYRLVRPLNLVLNRDKTTPAARLYIDFIQSAEGQKIVRDSGYIPIAIPVPAAVPAPAAPPTNGGNSGPIWRMDSVQD